MDISKESVDVFSWRRVYAMDFNDSIAYIKRQCEKGVFKSLSALTEEEVLKDKIVLDAGCGPGLKTCPLAAHGPKLVVGIDGAHPSLEVARAHAKEMHLTNTVFIQGYLENIPELLKQVNLSKVDFIFNSQVIHHTTDWRKILKIFYDVLTERGYLSVSWLDISSNWGQYMIKNKIAYHLGRTKESRIRIGELLFGWLDRRKKKLPIAWESFYADRYAAFYKIITVRQMVRALTDIGFEILDSYPCIDWKEWRRQELQKPLAQQQRFLLRLLAYRMFRPVFTLTLRVRQFMGAGGDVRVIDCRKK